MASSSLFLDRPLPDPSSSYPLNVTYCGECGMPLEYCEFSPTPEKCMEWLGKHLPDEFEKLKTGDGKASISTSADPVPETASGEAVTNSAQKPSRQTRGGKANTTSVKKITTKQQIQLFRSPRGKNKFTTSVVGLSTFGIDLRAASKIFGQKFATGSSVTGNKDEICIQGDVKDDLVDLIMSKWPEITDEVIEDLGEMKR